MVRIRHNNKSSPLSKRINARREAGTVRIDAATEHLIDSVNQIEAAQRDLCSVLGASPFHHELTKLAKGLKEVRYKIETWKWQVKGDGSEEGQLDREATILDLKPHAACGKMRR